MGMGGILHETIALAHWSLKTSQVTLRNLGNNPLPGPANILIVDDRPENLIVMKAVLEGSPDYMITTASSGAEAIELVKMMDFALILLDIQMPVMDGYETAVEMKKLERGKNVPIVMVTAIF